MLQSQLAAAKTDSTSSSSSYLAGTYPNICIPPSNHWIHDSSALAHICFSQEAFTYLLPVSTSMVLPDGSRLPVYFARTVKLLDSLLLKPVLFLPQFKYNLLSISALTADASVF